MYTAFFGLRESPFSIAPNPRYLYMSDQHREALAHLQYGIRSTGGFVMLSGEIGAGKTTLCRLLLNKQPADSEIAFIFNPAQTSEELFLAICEELEIALPRDTHLSLKELQQHIYHHLLASHAAGQSTLLIIDEAQSLPLAVLEQLRLLTNLETDEQKLLKIILLGQPELKELIAHPSLKQLSQRITARFHLSPLTQSDIQPYIQHRLTIAGGNGQLFSSKRCREIYRLSNGIPRLINVLCDRALLGAYTRNTQQIDQHILAQAARETLGIEPDFTVHSRSRKLLPLYLSLSAITLALLTWLIGVPAVQTQPVTELPTKPAPVAGITPPPSDKPATSPSIAAQAAPSTAENSQYAVQPSTKASATTSSDAYTVLLSLWQLPTPSTEATPPCQYARLQGLRCLSGNASLQKLAELNRPAILQLESTAGPSRVVLTALTESSVTIIEHQQQRRLSHDALSRLWDGSYTLLWRPPAGYSNALRRGQHNPSISWLKARLAILTSAPLDTDSHTFDTDLEFWVKAFQRSRGLSQDGVVGPRTLIHLNSVTSDSVPLLRSDQG